MPRFECPRCGAQHTFDADEVIRRQSCPTCGVRSKIPAATEQFNADSEELRLVEEPAPAKPLEGKARANVAPTAKRTSTNSIEPGLHHLVSRGPEVVLPPDDDIVDVDETGLKGLKLTLEMVVDQKKLICHDYLFEQRQRKLLIFTAIPIESEAAYREIVDASVRTVRFQTVHQTPSAPPKAVAQDAADSALTISSHQLAFRVREFSSKEDISEVAKKALRQIPRLDLESLEYDGATKTLTLNASLPISTKPISDALANAGIQTFGVQLRPLKK